MANLTRYKQKIFANNSNQVGVFGTGVNKVASKNVETLQSADYEDGWSAAIITDKNYPIWQERDGVDYGFSYQLAYLMQKGIPDWLSTEEYYQNDFCKLGNIVYYSLQDNNINQNPSTETTYWQVWVDLDSKMDIDGSNAASSVTFADGEIVYTNQTIIENTSLSGSTNLSKTVVLPDDGYTYLVYFRGSCTTGATSQNKLHLTLRGNVDDGFTYCAASWAVGNFATTFFGSCVLPMKYGSKNLTITRDSSYNGTATLTAVWYRRMGNNT